MSKLPKIGDVENESSYGYVFAVSGPGEFLKNGSVETGVITLKKF